MKYETWISETKRGVFTPRSTALSALDTAFRECQDSVTGPLPARKKLFDKLVDWMEAQKKKGSNWTNSTRNSTKVNGMGTVERLFADFDMQPYFQQQIARLNVFQRAPVVSAGKAWSPGKWDRTKDQDGRWHDFIRQQKGNSCVPTSIVMVKRAFHSLAASQLSEAQIRGVMALEERGNLNQGISSVGAVAQNLHDWEIKGTGPKHAVKVLRAQPYPVASARKLDAKTGQGLLDELRKCTSRRPGLIGWRWARGGHFTVCCGPTKDNSKLLILDPYHGVEYVENSNPQFTSYRNGKGRLGVAIVCA